MRIAICDDDASFCTQTLRMIREVLAQRGIEAEVEAFAGAAALLPKPEDETLAVRTTEGEIWSVPISEIVWAETDGHYQKLRLSDGQEVRCRLSGVELWERLSSTGLFVQANKGVILGVRHVRTLAADKAVLSDGETVSVSRRALSEVRNSLFRYSCR